MSTFRFVFLLFLVTAAPSGARADVILPLGTPQTVAINGYTFSIGDCGGVIWCFNTNVAVDIAAGANALTLTYLNVENALPNQPSRASAANCDCIGLTLTVPANAGLSATLLMNFAVDYAFNLLDASIASEAILLSSGSTYSDPSVISGLLNVVLPSFIGTFNVEVSLGLSPLFPSSVLSLNSAPVAALVAASGPRWSIPEPPTWSVLLVGVAGLAALHRRRRQSSRVAAKPPGRAGPGV